MGLVGWSRAERAARAGGGGGGTAAAAAGGGNHASCAGNRGSWTGDALCSRALARALLWCVILTPRGQAVCRLHRVGKTR